MSAGQVAGFLLVAVLLAAAPGPAVLFVVARTLAVGRRGALLSEFGMATGSALQLLVVAVGLGAVLAASEAAFTVVKLLGAGYLVYLGGRSIWRGITHRRRAVAPPVDAGVALAFRQGLIVGTTNPKTTVFLAAVLPQFVIRGPVPVPLQLAALGVELLLVALLTDLVWMLVAGLVRGWLVRSPARQRGFEVAGGACMVTLGGVLALTRRATG